MRVENDWQIIFYTDEQGQSPVEDFLTELEKIDKKIVGRFIWSLDQLKERNVKAREPLVRQIEGKIWELREESNTNIFRIMYFFYTGKKIILLHGFQKKSQKTPKKEIEVARKRMEQYIKEHKDEL
jgi:phage-related protein